MTKTIIDLAIAIWRQGPDRDRQRLRGLVCAYARAAHYQLDPGLLENRALMLVDSSHRRSST